MATTIAVKETTLQMLNNLKEKMKAKSLDETITKAIQKIEKIPDSMFGASPGIGPFREKDRAKFRENDASH